ncbi:unnamed protein product, partial [Ectocarpus sp. 8 AP-2014]
VGARSRQRHYYFVSPSRPHQETSTPSVGGKALAQRSLNDRYCCTEPREHSAIIAASRVPYTANSRHAHREGAMAWGWVGLSILYCSATGKNRSPTTGSCMPTARKPRTGNWSAEKDTLQNFSNVLLEGPGDQSKTMLQKWPL